MSLIIYRKTHGESIQTIQSRIRNNLAPRKHFRFSNILQRGDESLSSRFTRLQAYKQEYEQFGRDFNQCAIKESSIYKTLRLINRHSIGCHWEVILEEIFGLEFNSCSDCGTLTTMDDAYYFDTADGRVCSDCSQNYSDDDEDNSRDFEYIGTRHSSRQILGHIPSSYDNRKPRVLLGLELELEVHPDYDQDIKAGIVLDHIGKYQNPAGNTFQYALIEEDCSLDRGFEIVTGYTGLDVHRDQLKFFKDRLHGCKSHNTDSCGLHIHICKSDMTMLHASKLILFINDPENKPLVYALARRYENGYCKIHNKKEDTGWIREALTRSKPKDQLCSLNWDRYEALNFHNEKTVEFRLFRGTLKYSTIMACLEFTYASWHFAKSASTNELKTDNFLSFICEPENRSDTRFLRSYLKDKGFVMTYESKPDLRKVA